MARRFTDSFPRLAELMPEAGVDRSEANVDRVRSTLRIMAAGCFLFIFQYWRMGLPVMSGALALSSLICMGLLYALERTKRIQLIAETGVFVLFVLLVLSNIYSGGFYDPNFSWFMVVPVGTAVVLGHWVAFRWTAATFLVTIAFWSLHQAGVHLENHIPESERAVHALANQASAVLVIGALIWSFVRSHARAEERALAAQKALLKERERLRILAHFDSLTTLPNRNTFEQSLARALAAKRNVGLVYVDIDRFKDVNDAFGYALGDALLIEVAQRFAAVVYAGPTPIHAVVERYDDGPLLARRGGDEFVVLLPDAGGEEAAMMARQLVRALQEPVAVSGHRLHVAASIGIALGPTDGTDVASLVRSADIALSRVKTRGTGGVDFFEEQALQSVRRRVLIETALRDAVAQSEMRLLYQPLFAMDGQLIGAEALLRWDSSLLGPVPPVEFIPIAERSGQMRELGRWVLDTACREAIRWPESVRISVNVSVAQLRGASLVQEVRDVLTATSLTPERLELEITESMLADDPFTQSVLEELREFGVSLALDDFGTGFSSLGMLRQLPVDRLKIDRSFVQSMHEDEGDAALVRTIVAMGRELGLRVLAEGVEIKEQLAALTEIGCHEVQGYLLGRPESAQAFRARVGRATGRPPERLAGDMAEDDADDDAMDHEATSKVVPIKSS